MNKVKKTINQFIRTGFFHIFGGSVINKIVTFLSSIVIVRILSKEEYGVFTYAWNIYSIIILLNGLGVTSAVMQLCSERSGDETYARRICSYASRFGLTFDILIAAALFLIGTFVPLEIQGAGVLLQMLCILPAIRLLFDMSVAYLRAQKRNQEFAKLNTANTVTVFLVSSVCAILFREKGMILGYYAAYLFSVFIALFAFRIKLFSKDSPLKSDEKRALLSIAIVSMCNNSLSQLLYQIDIFALGIITPQEEVLASYRVATLIPTALTFIPVALITYIYPYFAQHRNDGSWCLRQYKKVLLGIGSVNLLISAFLFVLAPWIMRYSFGQQYADAVPIFRLLSLNYFVSGTFRTISGNLLVTQRKLKYNLFVAIVSGSVNIIADFLFISWWGSMGAAIATMAVVFLTAILNTGYLIYNFKKNR